MQDIRYTIQASNIEVPPRLPVEGRRQCLWFRRIRLPSSGDSHPSGAPPGATLHPAALVLDPTTVPSGVKRMLPSPSCRPGTAPPSRPLLPARHPPKGAVAGVPGRCRRDHAGQHRRGAFEPGHQHHIFRLGGVPVQELRLVQGLPYGRQRAGHDAGPRARQGSGAGGGEELTDVAAAAITGLTQRPLLLLFDTTPTDSGALIGGRGKSGARWRW